jgi:hypothetical protein
MAPMGRLGPVLAIAVCCATLPWWSLAEQRGWVTVYGTRAAASEPFTVQVHERDAFSSTDVVRTVTGAQARFVDHRVRRSSGYVELVLETTQGPQVLLQERVGARDTAAAELAPVSALAARFNAARDSGALRVEFELEPQWGFGLMAVLAVLLSALGLGVGFVAWRAETRRPA